MTMLLCPDCQHMNAAQAWHCAECGARLAEDDTEPGALLRLGDMPGGAAGTHAEGALWLDDLARVGGAQSDAPSDAQDNADAPQDITLRLLDVPPAPPPEPGPARRSADKSAAPDEAAVVPPGLWMSDPEVAFPAGGVASSGVRAMLAADPAERAAAKAAKRAAVRRARLGTAAAGAASAVPEVLVLDADENARVTLCTLLNTFGFQVYEAAGVEEAAELLESRFFVAAFLDIPLDGSDGGAGIDLCGHAKRAEPPAGGQPTALALVAARLRPVERVRAKMAGCDAIISKPASRGDVARMLEAYGVALPADARRG
jgi:CheY-like chemotaxis protein